MFRLRRYRVYLILAVFIIVGLLRLRANNLGGYSSRGLEGLEGLRNSFLEQVPFPHASPKTTPIVSPQGDGKIAYEEKPNKPLEIDHGVGSGSGTGTENTKTGSSSSSELLGGVSDIGSQQQPPPKASSTAAEVGQSPPTPTVNSIPPLGVPDRTIVQPGDVYDNEEVGEIHQDSPGGRYEPTGSIASSQAIHWTRQPENFPVPTESIIHLPTGKPVVIPRIQHKFTDESPAARTKRLQRQTSVRDEFKQAWKGYREKAWMHDEVAPVTGKFRDPFSGWGATLVDALDTLWIMGLTEEFEEAVKAVKKLDFTTSHRNDIAVFETTIRYLGGLLAAYDVSGAKYTTLLDKAVELAEILMGAFDTPNRMPILFYRWKPAFASQPHRASERANLAELGSLSMEFTRLAQITKQQKYYDAVARITNALEEFQTRGTRLDGMFPADIDASGCNHTVPASRTGSKLDDETAGYKPKQPANVVEPKPKGAGSQGPTELEISVIPGQPGQPNKALIKEPEDETTSKELKHSALSGSSSDPIAKRQLDNAVSVDTMVPAAVDGELPTKAAQTPAPTSSLTQAEKMLTCEPQGLASSVKGGGRETYSLGGGHDSTYEYFPKQYLLLGGLADQYRKMYLKVMAATRKYLVYRPNVPGNPDILFTGRLSVGADSKQPDWIKLTPEITHLTCFVGGMIGMGSRIFNIDSDLELAKKLTDGCVWAYGSTESGIMPEMAEIMTCDDINYCEWNETIWRQKLDPDWDRRESMIKEYYKLKAQFQAEIEAEMAAEEAAKSAAVNVPATAGQPADYKDSYELSDSSSVGAVGSMPNPGGASSGTGQSGTLNKRDAGTFKQDVEEIPKPITHDFRDDSLSSSSSSTGSGVQEIPKPITHDFREDGSKSSGSASSANKASKMAAANLPAGHLMSGQEYDTLEEERVAKKLKNIQSEISFEEEDGRAIPATKTTRPDQTIPQEPLEKPSEDDEDEYRPMTHKEFTDSKIAKEDLPLGYTRVNSKKYILRPEAIESVWYMYRLTGDTTWQDKGWAMWEAIQAATKTTYGNSAIADVLKEDGGEKRDEMESFWLAETLKYFYLLYSTPDVISLDEWVLNTEAHPFKRPT